MSAVPGFTPDQKTFFATVAADIKANPDFYQAGAEYLDHRFSAKALKKANPSHLKRGWYSRIDVRLTNAFGNLLREGLETPPWEYVAPTDLQKAKAVLVLTWLLTDPVADAHPLGTPFGPWQGDPAGRLLRSRGRAKAAFVNLNSLRQKYDGPPARIEGELRPAKSRPEGEAWAALAEQAWEALQKLRPAVSSITAAADTPQSPTLESPHRTIPPVAPPKGVSWQAAKKVGEAHCKRNPFPGVRTLARIVRCSPSTMSKAIDHSATLRAKLVEHEAHRTSASTGAMTERASASVKQTREPDPMDAASASTDDLFHRLLEQAKPSERAKLNAMTQEQRRSLIATMEYDPDKAQSVRGPGR